MFNFTNTIPGIVLSILNPLTYLIFTLSLCPVHGWGNWRHGEVIKLAQGHTVCEFCAGSMVSWLGRNFIEMGLSILGTLKCRLCASANSEMRYDPPPPPLFMSWFPCWTLINWDVSLICFSCSSPPACPLLANHNCASQMAASQSFLPQKVKMVLLKDHQEYILHQN